MMESKKWSQFLVHASIVCFGLALETFYPAVRVVLCNPIAPSLIHQNPPSSDNLTAQVGLNIGLEPILQRLETNPTNYENWGDYPTDSQSLFA
jgi:hypothetical protein